MHFACETAVVVRSQEKYTTTAGPLLCYIYESYVKVYIRYTSELSRGGGGGSALGSPCLADAADVPWESRA